jgi:hypothetical protein
MYVYATTPSGSSIKRESDHVQNLNALRRRVYSVFQPAFLHLLGITRSSSADSEEQGRNQKSRSTMTVPGDDDPVPMLR